MSDNKTTDTLQDFYGEAGYLLLEMLSVEQYNLTSYQFGPFGDVLVRGHFGINAERVRRGVGWPCQM